MNRGRKLARKHNAPKEDPKTVGKGKVSHFHGVFIGYAVLVRDRAEMEDLVACGSFGKVRCALGHWFLTRAT